MGAISVHAGARATEAEVEEAVSILRDAARRHLDLDLDVVDEAHAEALAPSTAVPLPGGGSLALRGWSEGAQLSERDIEWLRVVAQLVADEVDRRRQEARRWRATCVQGLLAALDARDGYTREHSEAVVELASATACALGVEHVEREEIEQVAVLHDLGKIAIPDPILSKAGSLSGEEWTRMRQHAAIGAGIVASTDGLAHLAPSVRATHERWDGLGYPDGLAGDEIPRASQIVALCDAYDAMVSPRPYRDPLRPSWARDELARGAGSQFCPAGVEALLALR